LEGTLLDIGSGIGALTTELLGAGLSTATCVDLSPSFLAIAKQEAARRGNAERMSWYQGDFVLLAPSLPPADVVVLDRVVCCYPAFSPLLSQAAGRSRRFLALSYPRDRWYVRVVLRIENLVRRLRGNGFQAFVHPVTAMEALLRSRGFTRASRSVTLAWSMDVYRRDAA
ncbi:MAG TPA: class I SAM-dependent methyltransferase, partial [Gemmatimonadales bacterium]|nr:class I SAM-dependent methyltransferase [Gemmatimonadales bacterium]